MSLLSKRQLANLKRIGKSYNIEDQINEEMIKTDADGIPNIDSFWDAFDQKNPRKSILHVVRTPKQKAFTFEEYESEESSVEESDKENINEHINEIVEEEDRRSVKKRESGFRRSEQIEEGDRPEDWIPKPMPVRIRHSNIPEKVDEEDKESEVIDNRESETIEKNAKERKSLGKIEKLKNEFDNLINNEIKFDENQDNNFDSEVEDETEEEQVEERMDDDQVVMDHMDEQMSEQMNEPIDQMDRVSENLNESFNDTNDEPLNDSIDDNTLDDSLPPE
ncbi:hypothetical protein ROZALSC1DRAFT_31593, partial [Rozella allomycis CSF55]